MSLHIYPCEACREAEAAEKDPRCRARRELIPLAFRLLSAVFMADDEEAVATLRLMFEAGQPLKKPKAGP